MLAMRCARRVLQPPAMARPIRLALPVRRFAKLSPDMKKKGGDEKTMVDRVRAFQRADAYNKRCAGLELAVCSPIVNTA